MELVLLVILFLIVTTQGLTNGGALTDELDQLYYDSTEPIKQQTNKPKIAQDTPLDADDFTAFSFNPQPTQSPVQPNRQAPKPNNQAPKSTSPINKVRVDNTVLDDINKLSQNVGKEIFDKYKY